MVDSLEIKGELFLITYVTILLFMCLSNWNRDVFGDTNCIAIGE